MNNQNILSQSFSISELQLKNRIVRSGTYEAMASEDGKVTKELCRLHTKLVEGGSGLIIPGYAFVDKSGQCNERQIGVYSDVHISGLKELVKTIHQDDAKTVLQLVHAGRQTVPKLIGGRTPMAPSSIEPDPLYGIQPSEMSVEEIKETIDAFSNAAARAKEADFDGVQIHATHGYLVAQFLSPHTNRRTDEWGGNAENRMRFLCEVYNAVRLAVGYDYPVLVKLTVEEGLPEGIHVAEAARHARRLSELGIDAIELSGGTVADTVFLMARGDIPIDLFTTGKDAEAKSIAEEDLFSIKEDVKYEEAYWLDAAEQIRKATGKTPLILVGGMKYPQTMERIVKEGKADLISLCRPLIREPSFPNEILAGRKSPSKCAFCNLCLAAAAAANPVRCYNR
jgi:2,4-dienoyl-CoA reductase-like NADH-dependent reductase (Old Yellow Enzyme family)